MTPPPPAYVPGLLVRAMRARGVPIFGRHLADQVGPLTITRVSGQPHSLPALPGARITGGAEGGPGPHLGFHPPPPGPTCRGATPLFLARAGLV